MAAVVERDGHVSALPEGFDEGPGDMFVEDAGLEMGHRRRRGPVAARRRPPPFAGTPTNGPWLQLWRDLRPGAGVMSIEPCSIGRLDDGRNAPSPPFEPGGRRVFESDIDVVDSRRSSGPLGSARRIRRPSPAVDMRGSGRQRPAGRRAFSSQRRLLDVRP